MSALGARKTVKRLLARHHAAYRLARRAYMLGRHACRMPHEVDFAAFRCFSRRMGLFLDVGANSGESVLSFRLFNRTAPILSIEPNPYHEPDLAFLKRRVRRFDYLLCAAGDRNDVATLYVPVYRDLPLTGEASFDPEQARGCYWVQEHLTAAERRAVRLMEIPVEVKRLDDLALKPAFIKIDVQGFEGTVVAGLRETIAASEPVLLIERSGCDSDLHMALEALGYATFVYVPAARAFSPYCGQAAQNLFFIPPRTPIPLAATPSPK